MSAKPRIAYFAGSNATIHSIPPLVTSNKARAKYGLAALTNPDGTSARFDVLRREVEAAGFKLVGEGDFLRHPEDTRDFSVNRPTGPVDEFVLKYQKPN